MLETTSPAAQATSSESRDGDLATPLECHAPDLAAAISRLRASLLTTALDAQSRPVLTDDGALLFIPAGPHGHEPLVSAVCCAGVARRAA